MSRYRRKSHDEETTYWLSYSDMMAAILLIFVLIISFTMLQSKQQYENKTKELEEHSIKMNEQQILLEEQQKLVEEQQKLVDEQKGELEEQKNLIEEQQNIMDLQQQKLDKIIGVRSELIEALKTEFDGTNLKVSVDSKTGAITLDSSILFDVNKYALTSSGENFLEAFLPRYLKVLLKKEFNEYISEIIIEGHTDTNGTYMYNLELSQERALSVATFCLKDDSNVLSKKQKEMLRKILTANGKSFSNPVYNEDGTVNLDASRRVEFKFRLKDEDMVKEMMDILSK